MPILNFMPLRLCGKVSGSEFGKFQSVSELCPAFSNLHYHDPLLIFPLYNSQKPAVSMHEGNIPGRNPCYLTFLETGRSQSCARC